MDQPTVTPLITPQPQPTQAPTSTYISNPFKMIRPSSKALGVAIGSLLGLVGLYLLPAVIAGIVILGTTVTHLPSAIAFVVGTVAVVAMIGIAFLMVPATPLVLLAGAKGQKLRARDALMAARPFVWRAVGITILTVLAILLGLVLLVIPGFIFSVWFSLAGYVLVNENLGVIASMRRSRELVRGRFWEMLGLGMLPQLIVGIPLIGYLVSIVLSVALYPAKAIRYLQLTTTPAESRPKVHVANYLVLLIVVVSFIAVLGFALAAGSHPAPASSVYTY